MFGNKFFYRRRTETFIEQGSNFQHRGKEANIIFCNFHLTYDKYSLFWIFHARTRTPFKDYNPIPSSKWSSSILKSIYSISSIFTIVAEVLCEAHQAYAETSFSSFWRTEKMKNDPVECTTQFTKQNNLHKKLRINPSKWITRKQKKATVTSWPSRYMLAMAQEFPRRRSWQKNFFFY